MAEHRSGLDSELEIYTARTQPLKKTWTFNPNSFTSLLGDILGVAMCSILTLCDLTDDILFLICWFPRSLSFFFIISLYCNCADFYRVYRTEARHAVERDAQPKFHRFMDLPFELRSVVIMMALEASVPPRIVNIDRSFVRDYKQHDKNTRLPSLLQVFREARAEILYHYPSYFPLAPAADFFGPKQQNFPYAAWEPRDIASRTPRGQRRRPQRPQTYHPERDIFFLHMNPLTALVNTKAGRFAHLDVRVLAIPDYMFCCFRRILGLLMRTRLKLTRLIIVVGDPTGGKEYTKLSGTRHLVPLEKGLEVVQIECQHCGQGGFPNQGEKCDGTGKRLRLEEDFNERHREKVKNQYVAAEVAERMAREELRGLKEMEGQLWGKYREWFKKMGCEDDKWKVPRVEIMRWRGWKEDGNEEEEEEEGEWDDEDILG